MVSENLDPYTVLGVGHTASAAEITRAYRTRLRDLHPDTRVVPAEAIPLADAQLWQVLAAYAVLRDPGRRADYDRTSTQPRLAGPTPHQSRGSAGPVQIPVTHVDKHTQAPVGQWSRLWAGPVRQQSRRIRVRVQYRNTSNADHERRC